jgi:hypothetical protein
MTMRKTWSGALASVDAQLATIERIRARLRGQAARGHGKH